jgi:hypothetical protein
MNEAQARGARSTPPNGTDRRSLLASWLGRIWLNLEPRRGVLFVTNIGLPILIGMARGEIRGALIGAITGLLLSLADNEGSLASRLRLMRMVAGGIAVGAVLGVWLKSFEAIFWIAFFLAVFAAGFLNQFGKGPHFSLRFGAISLAVVASFPAMSTLDYVYWGIAVLISLASRTVDHLISGHLNFAGPWFGAGSFDRWGWIRFAFLLPSQVTRFWIFSGLVATVVLLAWDLGSGDPTLEHTLLWERLEDMAVGATLVLVFTVPVFPAETTSLLKAAVRKDR